MEKKTFDLNVQLREIGGGDKREREEKHKMKVDRKKKGGCVSAALFVLQILF